MNRFLLTRQNRSLLSIIILSLFIFGLAYFAPVKAWDWDPKISLVASQAIIEYHSIKLNPYLGKLQYDLNDNYRTEKIRGHYYYRYPIGTSIFSLPVVWVANVMGWNMVILEHEFATQNFISATLVALIFVIIYQICRCYLSSIDSLNRSNFFVFGVPKFYFGRQSKALSLQNLDLLSLVIAVISVLGSALISTVGAALWNINFTVLFSLLTLLHLARHTSGQIKGINPYWVAFLLFAGYLCRPTAAFFSIVVLGYLLFESRAIFFKTAGLLAILLGSFITFNWFEYGRPLQAYYLPQSHLSTTPWPVALYGNLFSPSRGIFIFSPFLVLAGVGLLWSFQSVRQKPLFWLAPAWFTLHLAFISKNEPWWGGHSYGPRIMADVIPALILITIFVWQAILRQDDLRVKKFFIFGYLAFGALAIFINSYQGLYNTQTVLWMRGVKEHPEYLFDWRHPQFLATENSIQQRKLKTDQAELDNYVLGDSITYASDNAVLWDWVDSGSGWRWSAGQSPRVVFKLGDIDSRLPYQLEILSGSLENKVVGITLNETKIGDLKLTAYTANSVPQPQFFTFEKRLLRPNDYNQITFHLPVAPDLSHNNQAGVAFVYLKIYPVHSNTEGNTP